MNPKYMRHLSSLAILANIMGDNDLNSLRAHGLRSHGKVKIPWTNATAKRRAANKKARASRRKNRILGH